MARNLTEQLVYDLGLAIVRGDYSADNSLPSEAEICQQFSVSRSATREAVKMLASKGLLTSRPRQGIRVTPETSWNLFDTEVLGWLLQSRPTREMLLEFSQMRAGIEPAAAALAAEFGSDEAIAEIESAWQRMVQAESGLDDGLDSDIAFHIAILRASGNRFFSQMSAFVETALRISIRFTNAAKGVAGADVEAHGELLKAIQRGDVKRARENVHALLDESIALIQGESAKKAADQ